VPPAAADETRECPLSVSRDGDGITIGLSGAFMTHPMMSPDEVERAIFFDFEGLADDSPALVGILVEGQLQQLVLRESLTSAAEATGLRVTVLPLALLALVERCSREDRRLVAFTSHESRTASSFAQIDLGVHYRDAHKIAKRWRNSCLPSAIPRDNSLAAFLKIIGYPVPRHLGTQQSAARLRYVEDQLQRRGSYAELTPVAKRKWKAFLRHNEADCRGMAALVRTASADLAAHARR
jgi:hypothetical protein